MKHIQLFFWYSIFIIPSLWCMEQNINDVATSLAHCNAITHICSFSNLPSINALLNTCTSYYNLYNCIPNNIKTKEQIKKLQFGIDRFLLENPPICLSLKKHHYINAMVHYAQEKNKIMIAHLFTHEKKTNRELRKNILKDFGYKELDINQNLNHMDDNIDAFEGRKGIHDIDSLFAQKNTATLRILIINNL